MLDPASHVVLRCNASGVIEQLVDGDALAGTDPVEGRELAEFVVPDGREHVGDLLEALNSTGLAFDRPFCLGETGRPVRMYAAGVRLDSSVLVALGRSSREAVRALRATLARNAAPGVALLRHVLDDRLALMRHHNRAAHMKEVAAPSCGDQAQRQEALERQERERDEFVSMAAHELRNPLSTIRFYAGCLLDLDLPEDEQQRFIAIIQEASAFMGQLIEEMLTVSAVEAGQLVLDLREADVCEVTRRCCDVHRLVAKKKHIQLHFTHVDDVATAVVDADKLVQVINNLLSNAVKFSKPGTEIVVRLTAQSDEVCIAVTDQGPGIPADEVSRLFKPFHRTSVRSTAGERSTGLGLAICRNIVDRHGGRLWVESEVGRGSTFNVELPRHPKLVPAETVAGTVPS